MPPSRPSFSYDSRPSDCCFSQESSPSSPLCIYRAKFFHVDDGDFICASSSEPKLKQVCKSVLETQFSSHAENVQENVTTGKSSADRMQFSLSDGSIQESVNTKEVRHRLIPNSAVEELEHVEDRTSAASEAVEEKCLQLASEEGCVTEGETEEGCVTPRAQNNETDIPFKQPVCPPAPRKPKATLRFFRRLIQSHHHTARSYRLRNPPLPVFFVPDFEAFFSLPQQKASLKA